MVGVEVQENSRDDEWVGKKREDPHLAPATRTEERKHAIDPSEEHRPADVRGVGGSGRSVVA